MVRIILNPELRTLRSRMVLTSNQCMKFFVDYFIFFVFFFYSMAIILKKEVHVD